MIDRVPVPLPLLGLSDNVAADQQEPGTTARALNVRGVDPRLPGRVRLAQRSGLIAHGTGAQVASGSPVVTMFQAVKDTPPERWIEVEDGDTSEEWSTSITGEPVYAVVGPEGNCYTLLASGDVVIHSERGKLLGTIDSQVPVGFSSVPTLGVDEDGAVYTMASFPRRQDGGAGRLYRMRKDGDFWQREAEYVFEWSPRVFKYDRGEILVTASRPEDWSVDPEEDGPAPIERLYRIGGVKGTPFDVWAQPAAHPAVSIDTNAVGDVFVASPRNADRAAANPPTPAPSVSWVPRDAVAGTDGVNAWEALYAHFSAIRAQNVQGLTDGAAPLQWVGATDDPDDFDEVIDRPTRRLLSQPVRLPVFDTNGMTGTPGFTFNGRQCMITSPSTGYHEKESTSDTAQHSQAIFPNMRDATGAGARFTVSILFRIEAFLAGDNPYYVFEQGDYSLSYDADGGGDTQFTFTYPGSSTTFGGVFSGVVARTFVFTFVHDGHGVGGASAFLHSGGTTLSATGLTVNINRANERTVIGGYVQLAAAQWREGALNNSGFYNVGDRVWHNGFAYECNTLHIASSAEQPGIGSKWTVVAKLGLNGAIAEIVTFLGGSSASAAPHDTANTSTLYQKVEGFIAWAYGKQAVFPVAHPYDAAASPPSGTGSSANWTYESALQVPQGITAKYARPDGRLVWVFDDIACGNGIACAPDDYFYTATIEPHTTSLQRVARHKDEGTSVRTSGVDTWAVIETGSGPAWRGTVVQIQTDGVGDLYIPWVDANGTAPYTVRRYKAEGLSGGPDLIFSHELASSALPITALPAGLQVDERDIDSTYAAGPEFIYIPALTTGASPAYSVRRIDVLARESTGSIIPREVSLLAVTENGTLSRWTGTAWSSVSATVLPGKNVWAATLFSKTILGNGQTYRVYDHVRRTLRQFEEATVGRIPPRCRLGAAWRGRVVLARGDSAHDWFMSAVADPFDWEFVPDVVTETQAISGASSQVGEVPDLVNALVPWSDDLLLFGCDSSIWRLTGDPMTSGELHRVSDITGMAFGQAWCKDPEQRIYFWGSRGGLYVLTPDGTTQPLSEGRIHRRLQEIDLGRYLVRLVWNDLDQGVHAFLVPIDGKGEPTHYFWERRTGAFWADQFHGPERQVRGVFLADGDAPTDRTLLLGGADGRIRRWSPGASDDDGEGIRATCLLGPVTPDTFPLESRLVAAEVVLARDQGGAVLGVAGTREADVPYSMTTATLLSPGRNGYTRVRARGAHLWVQLGTSDFGSPWAVEDVALHIAPAGRKR